MILSHQFAVKNKRCLEHFHFYQIKLNIICKATFKFWFLKMKQMQSSQYKAMICLYERKLSVQSHTMQITQILHKIQGIKILKYTSDRAKMWYWSLNSVTLPVHFVSMTSFKAFFVCSTPDFWCLYSSCYWYMITEDTSVT
jgi:hypothetical protein